FLTVYRVIAALIVFVGATMEMDFVWNVSDLLMGIMTIINVPIILILGGQAMNSLKDYIAQKDKGLDPVFKASSIGLDESKLDYWK
ncbi:MAG: alanine:cation symporter family protein, partial [Tissierellia bacterium]|nr:alanine:cation symporter family protein [Tissierellia bacterium]